MIGEMTAAKKKSVWQRVCVNPGSGCSCAGGGGGGGGGDVLMQANMTMKYTMLPLNAMRHQKGSEQTRQVRVLSAVLRWSAYQPLKGDARVWGVSMLGGWYGASGCSHTNDGTTAAMYTRPILETLRWYVDWR